jgi:hypothetical protein
MKVCLGNQHDSESVKRVSWIQKTFDPSSYKITSDLFVFNNYYVEFNNERDYTFFLLRWA